MWMLFIIVLAVEMIQHTPFWEAVLVAAIWVVVGYIGLWILTIVLGGLGLAGYGIWVGGKKIIGKGKQE
jgi:hypothetical protein